MSSNNDKTFASNAVDAAIKIFAIGVMVSMSFEIIRPFAMPVLWAVIIAVAVSPIVSKLSNILGGRRKVASTLFTLAAVAALLVPVYLLAGSSLDVVQGLAEELKNDELVIPPAPESVSSIPVVGKKIGDFWNLAASDFKRAVAQTAPLAQETATTLVASISGGLKGVLQFVISFIIAGVFMVNPDKGFAASKKIASGIAGNRGEEFTKLAVATIRGVMNGVVGVAVIQAILGTIGMVIIGVPAAGVWGVLILVVAIIQLPPIIILGPVAAYVFTAHDTTPAIIFLIWSFLVSFSDGILKPVLMARGLDTPMLVILLGAIGGMIMAGIIGLFVGAVVLSITYTIFMAWVNEKNEEIGSTEAAGPPAEEA